ncbi:hypothetical protein GCM10027569_23070 [Flindersiella endophytica]
MKARSCADLPLEMEPGTNWDPVPNGTRYQTGPGTKRNPVPNGTRYQTEPGTKRNPVPNGTRYQTEPGTKRASGNRRAGAPPHAWPDLLA